MLIIIPESCFCPVDVSKADSNFQFAGHVGHQQTRCGNVRRDYKSSIYHFKFVDAKKVEVGCFLRIILFCSYYVCVAQFSRFLLRIQAMSQLFIEPWTCDQNMALVNTLLLHQARIPSYSKWRQMRRQVLSRKSLRLAV